MDSISIKRILKDLQILDKNKEELNKSGIWWYIDEFDIHNMSVLIIPKHKYDINDVELTSPYTGGMFLFKFKIPTDFPLNPPTIEFFPKQNLCRLHPNYYEFGKVCLSVINTWSTPDWTPSTSLMSLISILEERFNERSICFEPSHECDTNPNIKIFNDVVEYAVFQVAICNVLEKKYNEYSVFENIIHKHWQEHSKEYILRLEKLVQKHPIKKVSQPHYSHSFEINYPKILQCLSIFTTCEHFSHL